MIDKKFSATYKNTEAILHIIDYDEPNNVRSLWQANLYLNNELRNDILKNKEIYLNFNLDHFCFASEDNRYVFIPDEGESFYIDLSTLLVFYLPYEDLSTLIFLGNYFYNNQLVVVHRDKYILVNLNTKQSQIINFKENKIVDFNSNNEKVSLKLSDLSTEVITL
ncbi:hypothetical protein CHRY9390_00411 [Chryseobacterium aquaeductus]|uniref:Uncharacterized protein n=1 Tax=Chryseobacterium aquaeductus TaxID=2675056 RepID=A0A9N8MLA9_9FLAO|nr:hypothetical protein [Chryseobacterium aquaeductus]CAA7329768.1 hypothetical protein CHRY9390_00411 [Chryseobacterium potabilaquae]CAD7798946.1 hypothetical protein CHRY9390_00411 [Chryseobacterium aquaeductus]